MSRLSDLKSRVERGEWERDRAKKDLERAKAKLTALSAGVESHQAAADLLGAAVEVRRHEIHDRVEKLVTHGVQAVFEREDYEFTFQETPTRVNSGIVPSLRSNYKGDQIEVPLVGGHGGGVCDVVSFVLRVVMLSLVRPRVSSVLILDEVFKNVADAHLRGVASLITELHRSAGVQFVLITHKAELLDAADVIYKVRLEDGESIFTLEHDLRDEDYHQAPTREKLRRRDEPVDDRDLTKPQKASKSLKASGKAGVAQKRQVTRRKVQRKRRRRAKENES